MRKKVRREVCDLISKDSKVIDIGCGKGFLLKELSKKIYYGLGVDVNKRKINFANKKLVHNLKFKVVNAKELDEGMFDFGIVMFVIHSLDYKSQIKVLSKMLKVTKRIIIVDYPSRNNVLIHLDEILAGHYRNFLNYTKIGMLEIIKKSDLKIIKILNKGIYRIWICNRGN